MDFEPEHLSWYQLTIEQNTEFYSAPPLLPVEDVLADIQDAGQDMLARGGYQQYEVSAYARSGRQSKHNLNYWRFGDYIGVGAGAHGKLTPGDGSYPLRRRKTRLPKHYLDAAHSPQNFCAGEDRIDSSKLKLEFLMNALRLNEGASSAMFEQRTGLKLSDLEPQWQRLKDQGLLEPSKSQIQASPMGLRFLNTLLEGFLD
jgi:oxygen-independent coproporphyrinogen-3 oxidase